MTLSRQTGRRLQYFVAYTHGQEKGTLGDEYRNRDPFNEASTYGIRDADRTHILNVSFNAFLPDGAKGKMDNPFGRGLLNGWQLSGIYTFTSGTPVRLTLGGAAAGAQVAQAYFGTPDTVVVDNGPRQLPHGSGAYLHLRSADEATTVSARSCSTSTASGSRPSGSRAMSLPPYNLRTPSRTNTT